MAGEGLALGSGEYSRLQGLLARTRSGRQVRGWVRMVRWTLDLGHGWVARIGMAVQYYENGRWAIGMLVVLELEGGLGGPVQWDYRRGRVGSSGTVRWSNS